MSGFINGKSGKGMSGAEAISLAILALRSLLLSDLPFKNTESVTARERSGSEADVDKPGTIVDAFRASAGGPAVLVRIRDACCFRLVWRNDGRLDRETVDVVESRDGLDVSEDVSVGL